MNPVFAICGATSLDPPANKNSAATRRRTAAAAAQLVATLVRGDAHQPGLERFASEGLDVAPGRHEGFLGRIFGGCRAAQDAIAEVIDLRFVFDDQLVEGSKVSPAGA